MRLEPGACGPRSVNSFRVCAEIHLVLLEGESPRMVIRQSLEREAAARC